MPGNISKKMLEEARTAAFHSGVNQGVDKERRRHAAQTAARLEEQVVQLLEVSGRVVAAQAEFMRSYTYLLDHANRLLARNATNKVGDSFAGPSEER